jgi:hypothetical protein
MKEITRLNYLHYADALDRLQSVQLPASDYVTKNELMSVASNGHPPSDFLRAVVASYGGSRSKRIDVAQLASDLIHAHEMRGVFSSLRCRGFSYSFVSDMTGFPYRLRRKVNLRLALIAPRDLFYPPRVRMYLPRHRANHYFFYEAPAIAFALGMTTRKAWYIFILQSDLTRRVPAYVRDHFRGWRKVLFANIIRTAEHCVDRIYLCEEDHVLEACHKDYPKPTKLPKLWQSIYRGTACDFRMDQTELKRAINIQLYDRHAPVYARNMYCLHLNRESHIFANKYNGGKT